jgi:glycosyltransferase involved in cell wall biosynthesis
MRGIPDVYCADDNWAVENFVRGVTYEWPTWTTYWTKDAQPRDEQAEHAQHEQDRQRPSGSWFRRRVESWLNNLEAKLVRRGIATTYSNFSPSHVCFVSDHVFRDSVEHGVFYPSSEIIHGGAATSKFYFRRPRATAQNGDPIWLLYVGTINRERGLHTLIEALHELPPQARALIRLTVAGDSDDEAYLQGIHEQVRALRLSDQVVFLGRVVVDGMPDIYRCHDILVVPSIRMDGLPLRMIEAMLSGCAVITTGSGGAIEIARAADLPLFRKDNPPTLAKVLEQLIRDRKSLNRIARRGQSVALEQFTCDRMVDRLALAMRSLIQAKRGSLCAAASQPETALH